MTLNSRSRQLDWSELVPATIIFRSLAPACSVSVLIFALLGVVATPMGWIASESLFLGSEEAKNQNPFLAEVAELNRSPYQGVFQATEDGAGNLNVLGVGLSGPRLVFEQTTKPFYAIFGGATTTREFLYFAVGGIWSIFVWSFAGLAITRISLLRLTRNEAAGLDDAFEYSIDFFKTCFMALSIPMLAALLLCIPTFLIGLLMVADVGALLFGLIWFVVLAISFLIGILLLGLFASWPLIVASVAAEGQNALDAVTRAYAYVFQRPVHYLFYVLVAVVFGGIVWLVAFHFTDAVVRLSFWSTAWGANRFDEHRIDEIKGFETPFRDGLISSESWVSRFQQAGPDQVIQPELETSNAGEIGAVVADPLEQAAVVAGQADEQELPEEAAGEGDKEGFALVNARRFIYFWIGMAKTLAAAFIHGLFWCMASAVYLLLRKDVDETAMDEIYVIEEKRTYDLPPLQSDEHGIPQIQPLPMQDGNNNADPAG